MMLFTAKLNNDTYIAKKCKNIGPTHLNTNTLLMIKIV